MKLIVGLGNPGKQYENTRHNVGFMAIDNYCNDKNFKFKEKFNGLYFELDFNNEKIIILKPQSYMNNSGDVVSKFVNYYKINIEDILIIYDDVNFEIGKYKVKKMGSSGGHNGIKDIIEKLKNENISRIKIGIGKNNDILTNYVLSKISNTELGILKNVFNDVNDVINCFINNGIEIAMTRYNK